MLQNGVIWIVALIVSVFVFVALAFVFVRLVTINRDMELADLVRGVVVSTFMSLVAIIGLLWFVNVKLEDLRPMTLQIDSGLREDVEFSLSGMIDRNARGWRVPRICFDGLEDSATIHVTPGGTRSVKITMNVPTLWETFPERVATGDLSGTVRVARIAPATGTNQVSIPVSVHVKTMSEVWGPVLWVIVSAAFCMFVLYLVSRNLPRPTGRLIVRDAKSGTSYHPTAGSEMEFDLSERKNFWFWNKDFVRVNTGLTRWGQTFEIRLPQLGRVPAFEILFTQSSRLIRCPKGVLKVRDAVSGDHYEIADLATVESRHRSQRLELELSHQSKATTANDHDKEDRFSFLPSGQSAFEDSARAEQIPMESRTLHDGDAIVFGDYELMYVADLA